MPELLKLLLLLCLIWFSNSTLFRERDEGMIYYSRYCWSDIEHEMSKIDSSNQLYQISLFSNTLESKFLFVVYNTKTKELKIYTALIKIVRSRMGDFYQLSSIDSINNTRMTIHNKKYVKIHNLISMWGVKNNQRLIRLLFIDSYENAINDNVHVYIATCIIDNSKNSFRFVIEEEEGSSYILQIVKYYSE